MKRRLKKFKLTIVGLLVFFPVVVYGQGAVRLSTGTAIGREFLEKPFGYNGNSITYSVFADYLNRSGIAYTMDVEGSGAAFENINYKISVLGSQIPVKMIIVKDNIMIVLTEEFRLDANRYKQYLVGQGWRSSRGAGRSVLDGTFDSLKMLDSKINIVEGKSPGLYGLEIYKEYE